MPTTGSASTGISGGRTRAAFLLPCLLLAWLTCLLPAARAAEPAAPELVVTDIFVDARADVDAAFLADGGRELAARAAGRLPQLLAGNSGWRVHADFLADPARDVGALAQAGERVYVRGVVTRADIRKTVFYGGLQVWTFSLGLRLEFFDIRSGQVWFGQDATVRIPLETAAEPDRATRLQQFSDALDLALETAATRSGSHYRPGSLEAVGTALEADGLLLLDRGTRQGLTVGAAGELIQGASRWLLRVQEAEGDWCTARVLAGNTSDAPPLRQPVRFSGVNGLLAAEGPPLAVAGAALPAAGQLDEWFDVDPATLGQWLHDALVDSRAFPMLPPLLAGSSSGAELAAAFFRAQSVFSAAGDVRQDEIVGHRSLPQALARLVVTHAGITQSRRLGYEARTLRLGLLLEIYDRRTHEVLLSLPHQASRVEKHNETYRQADLGAAWRELARSALGELARQAAAAWRPAGRDLTVTGVAGETVVLDGKAAVGERGLLLRPGEPVLDRQGRTLARRMRQIGLCEVRTARPRLEAERTVGDGVTAPAAGDLLRLPAWSARPNTRIRHVQAGGPKVDPAWTPDTLQVALWAHQAMGAGRFNMLAPEALAAEVAAAEVALAGGEFVARPLGEILLNDSPEPQILVDVRVGLARTEREATQYKATLGFTTGVELSFFSPAGEPLPLFVDAAGNPTHQRKKAWTLTEHQVLVEGQVVQGVPEAEYPELLDACLRTCLEELGKELGGGPAKGGGS